MDNVGGTAFDANGNRALTGRAGLVSLHRDLDLELGFSGAAGDLRSGTSAAYETTDPRHYAADFSAFGPDLTLGWKGFGLRAYYYISQEDLADAPQGALDRDGLTVEPRYAFDLQSRRLKRLLLHGRYSFANEETLAGTTFKRLQYGMGVNFHITAVFQAKVGYVIQQEERSAPEVDNDAFNFSLTAEF